MKILVVDDSPTARQLTVKCLRELGCSDIVEASDGKQALQKVSYEPGIELVLLDRYMPNMDGLEFLRLIREQPGKERVRISMVTSEDDADEKYKTVTDYAADYYITKPITVPALVRMFARVFPGSS